eukprot:TRINITY_DN2680_c0_g1_i2.p1 TRINITY_DN2680_c0_g1~~TRINITY_DN2680_c0_g1_i2.p1  ORF type:complete len:156 (+),score=3.48 TRINITY_DN2680_c0_g1_i2:101-568(+)
MDGVNEQRLGHALKDYSGGFLVGGIAFLVVSVILTPIYYHEKNLASERSRGSCTVADIIIQPSTCKHESCYRLRSKEIRPGAFTQHVRIFDVWRTSKGFDNVVLVHYNQKRSAAHRLINIYQLDQSDSSQSPSGSRNLLANDRNIFDNSRKATLS